MASRRTPEKASLSVIQKDVPELNVRFENSAETVTLSRDSSEFG